MNGVVEITVKKKKHVLRFGWHGCMEFQQRAWSKPGAGELLLLTELIYSGLYGDCMRNEKPKPDYGEVFDLVDSLSEEKNYSEQIQKVWDCYNESKWGKEFMAKIAELNKKKAVEEPSQATQE